MKNMLWTCLESSGTRSGTIEQAFSIVLIVDNFFLKI